MKKAILATKSGMTQIFNEDGVFNTCNCSSGWCCVVTQVKTVENDSYDAVQVVLLTLEKLVNKPVKGHFDKAGVPYKRFLREFKFEKCFRILSKDEIKADIFAAGDKVDATAISKGKRFRGNQGWAVKEGYYGSWF